MMVPYICILTLYIFGSIFSEIILTSQWEYGWKELKAEQQVICLFSHRIPHWGALRGAPALFASTHTLDSTVPCTLRVAQCFGLVFIPIKYQHYYYVLQRLRGSGFVLVCSGFERGRMEIKVHGVALDIVIHHCWWTSRWMYWRLNNHKQGMEEG